jgi:UDP-N-acetylglucosamine--N-acetylmuramyl-(pentapeptide) pyrophosphoryl-undecaprenol N-acetylglucosamine transferase
VLWATGPEEFCGVRDALAKEPEQVQKMIRAVPYIEKMDFAYAAADLAVCRAGATTIAELIRAGCPAILVPYPFAAADHQTGNARTIAGAGAAVLLKDDELGARLFPELRDLVQSPVRRRDMRSAAAVLAKPRAAELLARAVLRLAGRA